MISRFFLSLCVFSFLVSTSLAEPEAKVASVNLRDLQPLLLDLAFADEKNEELQKKYLASKASQEKMQKAMQKLMLSGEGEGAKSAKWSDIMQDEGGMERMGMDKQIANVVRAELIGIIEDIFEKKYVLVIDINYADPILYTEIVIPDVTANVRQYLLKQAAGKEK